MATVKFNYDFHCNWKVMITFAKPKLNIVINFILFRFLNYLGF